MDICNPPDAAGAAQSSLRMTSNHPLEGTAKQTGLLYFGHEGDKMIVLIVVLTLFFVLGSISPLLVTDEMQDIVAIE